MYTKHPASHTGSSQQSYEDYARPEYVRGKHAAPQPPQKKKKNRLWNVLFVISLIFFLSSCTVLSVFVYSYWQGQASYDHIAEEALVITEDLQAPSADPLHAINVDWDTLRSINPDIVAWIYIPDTVVNYPVVQTSDNATYLTRDFGGGVGGITHFGTIFVNSFNSPHFTDDNDSLFGHHMNNGSMFAFIDGLRNTEEFNKHRIIYLMTPTQNYELETFSVINCHDDEPIAQTNFRSELDYKLFVEEMLSRNEANPNPALGPDEIGKIFTLITCDNISSSGREALFATPIRATDADGKELDVKNWKAERFPSAA